MNTLRYSIALAFLKLAKLMLLPFQNASDLFSRYLKNDTTHLIGSRRHEIIDLEEILSRDKVLRNRLLKAASFSQISGKETGSFNCSQRSYGTLNSRLSLGACTFFYAIVPEASSSSSCGLPNYGLHRGNSQILVWVKKTYTWRPSEMRVSYLFHWAASFLEKQRYITPMTVTGEAMIHVGSKSSFGKSFINNKILPLSRSAYRSYFFNLAIYFLI